MAQRSSSKSRKDKEEKPDLQLASIGNYTFQKTLGEGNFAKVKLATHKMTGQEVAIKIIDKTQMDEKKLHKLYREVRIMKLLHHPNIVKLYEVIETKQTMFLVMEYVSGGELYDYLVVHGKMKEKEARAKFRQILSAVSYCHKKKVIHRDLKAENLLLDNNLNIKIADFGFSNNYDPEGKLDTFCGSPPYAAPELFQGRHYTGPEVDIWSLGVILYVLTTGCLPFDGKNLQEMRESVCRGKYRIPFYLSETCEKLLRKFLVRDPSKRGSLDILIDDPWINESYDESPISKDLSETVEEDESIIKLVEAKFNIDRETIVKNLRSGNYNDTAALYYLLYYEKQSGRSPSITAESIDVVQAPTPRREKSITPATLGMSKIEEDAVLATPENPTSDDQKGNSNAAKIATRRKRAATTVVVGKNGEDKDRHDSKPNESEDAQHLRPNTAAAPLLLPNSVTIKVDDKEKTKVEDKEQQGALSVVTTAAVTESPIDSQAPTPTDGPSSAKEKESVRKRTNTIVGIFKRRTSENTNENQESGTAVNGEDSGKPRSLRFTFNSNTTSSKHPDEIMQEIIRNCNAKQITHRLISKYLLECANSATAGKEAVKFEVEVCKLPRLNNLHGLRFKRVSGPSADYKEVCETLLAAIQL